MTEIQNPPGAFHGIEEQIKKSLEGVPEEEHAITLRNLWVTWQRDCKAGLIPPGTLYASLVIIENMLERLPRTKKPRRKSKVR